jgi:hypothetical protein
MGTRRVLGMKPRIRAAVTCLALMGALLAFNPIDAHAAWPSATTLPFNKKIGQLVVDDAHSHVFVSGGSGQNGIAVLDFDGNLITTLAASGATGMVIVGNKLYAAETDGNQIVTVNTASSPPTLSTPISIATYTTPTWIGYTGGKLWFSALSATSVDDIVKVNVNGTGLALGFTPPFGGMNHIATSTALPNALFIGDGPDGLRYDVSTSPPTQVWHQFWSGPASYLDLAIQPDGTEFVDSELAEFPTATGASPPTRWYLMNGLGVAVAVTAGGGGLVAGETSPFLADDAVYIFRRGSSTAFASYPLTNYERGMPNGLGFSADGSRLFAAGSFGGAADPVHLDVFDPSKVRSLMTFRRGTQQVRVGDPENFTGTLAFQDGSSAAGAPVDITRTPQGGSPVDLGSVSVAGDGSFGLSDAPPAEGIYTYDATYAGSGSYLISSESAQIEAIRINASVSISGSASKVKYGSAVTLTAHLGPGTTSRDVHIDAQPDGEAVGTLVSGTVDGSGNLTVKTIPLKTTHYTVVFDGDARTAPTTSASLKVNVQMILGAKLSRHYRVSGGVHFYHAGVIAKYKLKAIPNLAGWAAKFTLERRKGSKWVFVDEKTYPLNSSSVFVIRIGGMKAGQEYRVRASIRSDTAYSGAKTPWSLLAVG